MAIAVPAGPSILQEESERQQHLAKLVTFTHRQMRKRGWQSPSGSQIVPCIVGDNAAQCGLPLHCRLVASISAQSGRQRCQLARLSTNFTDAQRRRGGCVCNA